MMFDPRRPFVLCDSSGDEQEHYARIGRVLATMHQEQEEWGADVELQIGNDSDTVHSAVVAAHSMFLRQIIQNEEPPITLDLTPYGLQRQAVRKAVDFMYSGHVNVTFDCVSPLLYTAFTLQMPELIGLIEGYIRQISQLRPWTVGCLNLCFEHPPVSTQTRQCVLHEAAVNFPELRCGGSDAPTQSLRPDALMALLNDQRLLSDNEADVFETAVDWLVVSPERSAYAEQVFACVRFSRIKTDHKSRCCNYAKTKGLQLSFNVQSRLTEADWQQTRTAARQPRCPDRAATSGRQRDSSLRVSSSDVSERPIRSFSSVPPTTKVIKVENYRPVRRTSSESVGRQGRLFANPTTEAPTTNKRNPKLMEDLYGRVNLIESSNEDRASWTESMQALNRYSPLPSEKMETYKAEMEGRRREEMDANRRGRQTDKYKPLVIRDYHQQQPCRKCQPPIREQKSTENVAKERRRSERSTKAVQTDDFKPNGRPVRLQRDELGRTTVKEQPSVTKTNSASSVSGQMKPRIDAFFTDKQGRAIVSRYQRTGPLDSATDLAKYEPLPLGPDFKTNGNGQRSRRHSRNQKPPPQTQTRRATVEVQARVKSH